MYLDTHCHLNFKIFDDDWSDVAERSLKNKVEMIIVSTDLKTSQKAIEIAKSRSGVWAAVGFHPIHVIDRDWRSEILRISTLINSPKVVAIGEIGFDRVVQGQLIKDQLKWSEILAIQKKIFDFFVKEAKRFNKPVILHCREALEVLIEEFEDKKLSRLRGVLHCFAGDFKLAHILIKNNFKIGFTGLTTYNSKWDQMIIDLDLGEILIETDAPFLSPKPHRGKRNEPINVIEVARHIAKLKNLEIGDIEKATYQNARKVFDIN